MSKCCCWKLQALVAVTGVAQSRYMKRLIPARCSVRDSLNSPQPRPKLISPSPHHQPAPDCVDKYSPPMPRITQPPTIALKFMGLNTKTLNKFMGADLTLKCLGVSQCWYIPVACASPASSTIFSTLSTLSWNINHLFISHPFFS